MSLPNGWRITLLGQVADVRKGVALGKTKLKDPVRLPYLRVANVQAGRLDLREVKTIEIERHQIERFALQPGDVLMTEGGDFDKLGRGDLWQGAITPCLHQNHVFAVRTDPAHILPGYLNALAGSAHGKRYFLSCAKRSTNLASISATQLKQFPVMLPPLAEQRIITNVLADWDQAIHLSEKLIANSRTYRAALLQRFWSGPKAAKWRHAALGTLAAIDPESLRPASAPDFTFRYIALADVSPGQIRATLTRHRFADAPARARRILRAGDVLMAMVRPNLQGYAQVDQQHADCIASTGFAVLRAHEQIDADFLYHSLFSTNLQRQIKAMVSGSSYPTLSAAAIASLTLRYPPRHQQQRIANLLSAVDARIAAETRQHALLLTEKQALIQQLLSGQRRVTAIKQYQHKIPVECNKGDNSQNK
jgi:type I restriction enzyme S subunit